MLRAAAIVLPITLKRSSEKDCPLVGAMEKAMITVAQSSRWLKKNLVVGSSKPTIATDRTAQATRRPNTLWEDERKRDVFRNQSPALCQLFVGGRCSGWR